MKFYVVLTCTFLFSFLFSTSTSQAQSYDWHRFESLDGYFNFSDTVLCESADSFVFSGLNLGAHCEMILRNCDTLSGNRRVCRYDQFHKGLPVLGNEMIVVENNGVITRMAGKWLGDLNVDTTVSFISDSAVIDSVRNFSLGNSFGWEDSTLEAELRIEAEDSNATWYPEVHKAILKFDSTIVVGFETDPVLIFGEDTSIKVYYLNYNGDSLSECNTFREFSPTINPKYICTGPVAMTTKVKNGKYTLRDDSRKIHTKKYGWVYWRWKDDVKRNDDIWDCAESEAKSHWNAQRSYDFFSSTFGYTGFRNGKPVRISHNSSVPIGANVDNKNWYAINFNPAKPDGTAFLDKPVELDIMGHEWTHCIISETTRFRRSGEPGGSWEQMALEESFCDIFGQCVEEFATGSINWGGGVNAYGEPGNRNLKTGGSNSTLGRGEQPQEYGTVEWNNSSYHKRGGPQNKVFQLLVDGGSHNSVNVQSITLTKARKIFFQTLMSVAATVDYPQVAQTSLDVTASLYGMCGFEYRQVQAAWKSVQVDAGTSCFDLVPKWNDYDYLVVFKEDINPGVSLDATVFPTGYFNDSVTSGISYFYEYPATWNASQIVDSLVISAINTPIETDTIWLNAIYLGDTIRTHHVLQIYDTSTTPTCYRYDLPLESPLSSKDIPFTANDRKLQILVFPQPSEGRINIESLHESSLLTRVDIFNNNGRLMYSLTSKGSSKLVLTTDLPDGLYFLRAEDNSGNTYHRKVIFMK